jgi:serine/threonine protein kinase
MATHTCPQCGAVNPAGNKFCDGCGINLTQPLHNTQAISQTPLPTPPAKTPVPSTPHAGPPTHTTFPRTGPASHAAPTPLSALVLGPGVALGDAGRYVVDRALGKGGMGSMFLAHDTRVNNKPVVIKQMLPNYTTDEERIEAETGFQEEMKTLSQMSHPNIPTISDFFTQAGSHIIVQEFVNGEDLQKKLDAAGGKGLPEKQVLGWISQVLSVLSYLEDQDPQVIHRDIKPANIVVDAANRVRVVDFGVASHRFRVGTPQAGLNKASTAMGTPGYAPREQFLGQETTLSDLYALGATMHQLLTGRNPQGVEPLFQYPPIRSLNPNVSEQTVHVVTRALQNDVKQRYQKAAQMKADVDAILTPKGVLSTVRGKLVAVVVVLAALIAAGGGAAVYEQRQATLPATGSISVGRIAFDLDPTGRNQSASDVAAWAKAKRDASVQWKNGNITQAEQLYAQASTNDQTDAESQIYVENAGIISSGQPYWKIGIGSSFSGVDDSTGRFAMQGAFTAQHEINLAGGIDGRKLVLELGNDASSAGGAADAAKAAAADKSLLAFLGYSFSSRTKASQTYLANNGIPQLSPTSSSPSLNGSPYFFRAVPSDVFQGEELAHYATGELLKGVKNPRVIVFRDPSDAYSNGLATIFTTDVGNKATLVQENYTADSTTADQYKSLIQPLFSAGAPNLIFFSGRASDALRMGQAMDSMGGCTVTVQNGPYCTTTVLSDDAFYDPAQFISYGNVYKGRYKFTGYFYPDEFSLLPANSAGAKRIQAMESEYRQHFQAAGKPSGYGFARVPSESALFYDAVKLLAQAIHKAAGPSGATPVTRASLRDAIAGIHYAGIAGQIHFKQSPPSADDPNALGIGDPIDKALLVMHLDNQGHTHPDRILGRFS